MNGFSLGLLAELLRTTVFLSGAAIAVRLLLKFGRPASPGVHRTACLLVLLTGWFWWRLPVTVPYQDSVATMQAPWAGLTGTRRVGDQERISANGDIADPRVEPALLERRELAVAVQAKWPVIVVGVWLWGTIAVVILWIGNYRGFLRQLRAAVPARGEWRRQWEELCARHGIRKAIPFRVTENVGPLLCRAPAGHLLVVPAVLWQQLGPAERMSILQHELAHWKRRDPVKSTIVRLMVLPHWFNPLAWAAAGWFDEAAEWACDEAAKGATSEGYRDYAMALLRLDAVLGPRLWSHAAASGRGLSVRVQRLLHPPTQKDSLMKKITILGIALGLALLGLVRVDLVAKDPAERGLATKAIQKPLVINFVAELGDKLTEGQRLYCEWDAETFELPNPTRWQHLNPQKKAAKEQELLRQLSSDEERQRVRAIDDLVALGSKKAVRGILKIAADRKEKNNFDRHTAVRALGMLGDTSVVPELVHLTYHYNWNARQWAQIALVRLTGQNFGRDVAAWSRWWQQQGGKPPIRQETVKWATSPRMLQMLGTLADPSAQEERDHQWVANRKQQLAGAGEGNYWDTYRRWAAQHKGTSKDSEEAKKLLAELVKDAHVVTFRPVHGFAPQTPQQFLAKFNDPALRSDPTGLGGGSFFRTTAKDGVLIGSFLTARPEGTRKALEATGAVEVLSVEKLTPEVFIRYEASQQESL